MKGFDVKPLKFRGYWGRARYSFGTISWLSGVVQRHITGVYGITLGERFIGVMTFKKVRDEDD